MRRQFGTGWTSKVLLTGIPAWTEVLLAYGLAKPRKNKVGGCLVGLLEPPTEEAEGDDDAQEEDVENDFNDDDSDDDEPESDLDDDDSNGDSSDTDPQETVEEAPPPVTEDQIGAAAVFVNAVGGVVHAVRTLMARSVSDGNKDTVKDALAEAIRAARPLLTPSEITEIVIVGNCIEKGIKWVSV